MDTRTLRDPRARPPARAVWPAEQSPAERRRPPAGRARRVRLGARARPRRPGLPPPLCRRVAALRDERQLLRAPHLGLRRLQRAAVPPPPRRPGDREDPLPPDRWRALLQTDLRERRLDRLAALSPARQLPRYPRDRRGRFSRLRR